MIAIIGEIKTTVSLKLATPERDIEKQKRQDEEALLQAGIDINEMKKEGQPSEESPEDARFRAYYESKMREQAGENYWSQVGLGSGDFGGYSAVANDAADIKVTNSGCAYGVALALGKTDCDDKPEVSFVSVVGNDATGIAATEELKRAGVDVSGVRIAEGTTPVEIEIHNFMGDLMFCRENNRLTDLLTPEFIRENEEALNGADDIFVDGSLPVETLNYISDRYAGKCRLYFSPGSMKGAAAFANSDMAPMCVMSDRMEAEVMTGLQILGMEQLMAAGEAFGERGVAKALINLKAGGFYYKDGTDAGIVKPERELSSEVESAGNAVSARILMEISRGCSLKEAVFK